MSEEFKDRQEIWKYISNTNKKYMISNFGRLKSLMNKIPKIMKLHPYNGYMNTTIVMNKGYTNVKVHRLVAQAFIRNIKNKPEVNHKDFDRGNNYVQNLEWVTPQENFEHSKKKNKNNNFFKNIGKRDNLKYLKGEEIGTSKLVEEEVIEIRRKFKPRVYTRKMLSVEYNVSPAAIKDVVLRKSWKWLK